MQVCSFVTVATISRENFKWKIFISTKVCIDELRADDNGAMPPCAKISLPTIENQGNSPPFKNEN